MNGQKGRQFFHGCHNQGKSQQVKPQNPSICKTLVCIHSIPSRWGLWAPGGLTTALLLPRAMSLAQCGLQQVTWPPYHRHTFYFTLIYMCESTSVYKTDLDGRGLVWLHRGTCTYVDGCFTCVFLNPYMSIFMLVWLNVSVCVLVSMCGGSICVYLLTCARLLEWVAIPFSRGSSRDWTWVSCIAGRFFNVWATREVHVYTQACINVSMHMSTCIGWILQPTW